MTEQHKTVGVQRVLFVALVLSLGGALGFAYARMSTTAPAGSVSSAPLAPAAPPSPSSERRVLYWYDPMKPEQHFAQPGRSPFMDMDLVPRYAEAAQSAVSAGVSIDARVTQNLGLRSVEARLGRLASGVDAVGEFQYNQRDIAKLQARADGFVERVYGRAVGDVVARDAPLADVLLPSWGAAQQEFLSVLDLGDPRLLAAARLRLRWLGMSPSLIAEVEKNRLVQAVVTLRSPQSGVLVELEVRSGMRITAGTTLATINGNDPVWLEVAVPERSAARLVVGAAVSAQLAAYAGSTFQGQVADILPAADSATRSVRVRVSFANRDGRLRPGLTARAHISEAPGEEVVLVPSAAVIRGGDHDRVIKIEEGGHYAPVLVDLGREVDGEIEVLQGLAAGERIAAAAQFLLDADASLKGFAPGAMSEQAP